MRRFLVTCVVLLSCAAPALAQSITCESIDGHYSECRGGSAGKAVLQMELSDNRCIEGTTYGTRMEGGVWVDNFCRGRFTLRGGSLTGNRRIICESQKGTMEWCPAELNNAKASGSLKTAALNSPSAATACRQLPNFLRLR
jgi:hypothetical protein